MGAVSNRQFAVITGASSGIGLELARQCVEHDFDLLICAQEPEGLAAAQQHLSAGGAFVKPVSCDLATFDGCEKLVRATEHAGRPVDALLLNAGIGVSGPFIATDLEEELRSISLNVISIVHVAKRLLPAMVARG